MNSREFLKQISGGISYGVVSIATAFVTAFLRVRLGGRPQRPDDYWQYATQSLDSLLGVLPSGLLLGFAALAGYILLSRSRSALTRWMLATTGLALFNGSMLVLEIALNSREPLGAYNWITAFLVSATAFTAGSLTSRIGMEGATRLVYSRPTQLLLDGLIAGASFGSAYLIRFDGSVPPEYQHQFLVLVAYIAVLQVLANFLWGVYSFMWRFTGFRESFVIAQSVASVTLGLLALQTMFFFQYSTLRIPLGILLIHPFLVYIGFLGIRTLRRVQYRRQILKSKQIADSTQKRRRLLLIGAGQAGRLLMQELEHNPSVQVVGFLDDDPRKTRKVIEGVRVLASTEDIVKILREHAVDEVVLTMPTAPKSVMRKVVARCEQMGVASSSLPSLSDVVGGKVTINDLRPVRMEDLLGRETIRFLEEDPDLIDNYAGRSILVTGGAGSIGSELVRQLKEFSPSSLVILDKDESGLFQIGLEIRQGFENVLYEELADIRDKARLQRIFERHRPEVIFHAAAYKHVPMLESHPGEGILNNVIGTRNLVALSSRYGVKSFVLVSSDKAVNPTNVMGATKRLAEILVQTESRRCSTTRYCCVRFGNVLGSRGSVVPIFQQQIAEGRRITVTHPEIERYFMSIPEAVQLVIQAGSLGKQGEIFVLDMGAPVRIVDLANELIARSGLIPGRDVQIEFTGLRPGEKLKEELLIGEENGTRSTKYPKIFVVQSFRSEWSGLEDSLQRLVAAAERDEGETICNLLETLDIGYHRSCTATGPLV